jgi:hypothetical protein
MSTSGDARTDTIASAEIAILDRVSRIAEEMRTRKHLGRMAARLRERVDHGDGQRMRQWFGSDIPTGVSSEADEVININSPTHHIHEAPQPSTVSRIARTALGVALGVGALGGGAGALAWGLGSLPRAPVTATDSARQNDVNVNATQGFLLDFPEDSPK